ncbi:unnamed protein product [Cylicocyclus nassatus]|uniref:Uncharacterized protein n=1 Tax=Cylicocyclus nassatus TaxID=53992 RepID=A0AA36GUD2_CYLNA|nr:unnamed protein product [Cylicocyclus nassatus]
MELEGEEQGHGPVKEGGTSFAAPASALLLERDGPKRGILTRVATTFTQLKEQFEEGGKIVTVWPPIMEKIADEWKKLIELWEVFDQTLLHQAKPGQCIVTGTKCFGSSCRVRKDTVRGREKKSRETDGAA